MLNYETSLDNYIPVIQHCEPSYLIDPIHTDKIVNI